jgi:hypothetical protein
VNVFAFLFRQRAECSFATFRVALTLTAFDRSFESLVEVHGVSRHQLKIGIGLFPLDSIPATGNFEPLVPRNQVKLVEIARSLFLLLTTEFEAFVGCEIPRMRAKHHFQPVSSPFYETNRNFENVSFHDAQSFNLRI